VNVLNEQNVTQSYIMDLVQTRTNTAEIEHATIAPYSWFGFPWHLVSLASVMGPGCCHEEGTTSGQV
jgi:hypothetical protein